MPQGTFLQFGFGNLFREVSPGRLIDSTGRGRIVPDDGSWEALDALYVGQGTEYRFSVGKLVVAGPARGRPVAATRHLFAGAEWYETTQFFGATLAVTALTNDAAGRNEAILAATIDRDLDDIESEAVWLILSFVSGHRLHALAIEYYDETGLLIRTEHHRGSGSSAGSAPPFHRLRGGLSPDGLQQLAEGTTRLIRAGFPVEVVIAHLHDANGGDIEVDAQHLVSAIHTAFEAWNRMFGRRNWVGRKRWERLASEIRSSISPGAIEAIPSDVRCEIVKTLTADINGSNRTTMGWRQRLMFDALQIDVSDVDNTRALGMRNELIHNGFFLKRWHELSVDEAQRRRDDVERLRRLARLVIFRLTGYEGTFIDPLNFTAEHVSKVALPDRITRPQQGVAPQGDDEE